MQKKLMEDETFNIILIVSIVAGIVTAILANTGSFIKDVFYGVVFALMILISISSAFMPKCSG